MNHYVLLAALDPTDMKGPSITDVLKSEDSSLRQTLIIVGAILVVVLGVVIWAAFIRKPRRAAHHGRDSERGILETVDEQKIRRSSRGSSGGGRRRRHRSRPRAKTLAETGGLPPIRDDAAADDTAP